MGLEERTLAHIVFDCPLVFSRARNDDNSRTRPSIYDLFSSIDEAMQLFDLPRQAAKSSLAPNLPGDSIT